jgi:hypothetical protein
VILTAYLDESGTHGTSPVTVMGGMLANARQWERFDQNFKRVKRKHKFKLFHTRKFKKRDGDFKGWSKEQCLALAADLALLTTTAFTESVTFTLDNADYEAEYKSGERPRKLRLDSAYGLCFRTCLLFFALEGLKRVHRGKYPKLNFVLESGHKNSGDALRIFSEMKTELKAKGCDMLNILNFADKDECDPLMMADFLAHVGFTMGGAGGRAPTHWSPGTNAPRPPLGRKESGVTHLRFEPGGLAKLKSSLSQAVGTRRPASVKAEARIQMRHQGPADVPVDDRE